MSILIKGMDMPESCPCELLGTGYDLYCSFARGIPARVKEYYECCQNNKRPSWCPLVPVPPHGRLIDADIVLSQYNGSILTAQCDYAEGLRDAVEDIKTAPTVIEAEEEWRIVD